MIELHQQPLAQVPLSLRTGPAGLGAAEAQRRLLECGPNRLREAHRRPLLLRLLKEFSHFFAVVLWLAAGLAFLLERTTPGGGHGAAGLFHPRTGRQRSGRLPAHRGPWRAGQQRQRHR